VLGKRTEQASTRVAAGKRWLFHSCGVHGVLACRLAIAALFKSFQPCSRLLTLPASVLNSTSPSAFGNACSLATELTALVSRRSLGPRFALVPPQSHWRSAAPFFGGLDASRHRLL
jgi:hypothetical protein